MADLAQLHEDLEMFRRRCKALFGGSAEAGGWTMETSFTHVAAQFLESQVTTFRLHGGEHLRAVGGPGSAGARKNRCALKMRERGLSWWRPSSTRSFQRLKPRRLSARFNLVRRATAASSADCPLQPFCGVTQPADIPRRGVTQPDDPPRGATQAADPARWATQAADPPQAAQGAPPHDELLLNCKRLTTVILGDGSVAEALADQLTRVKPPAQRLLDQNSEFGPVEAWQKAMLLLPKGYSFPILQEVSGALSWLGGVHGSG